MKTTLRLFLALVVLNGALTACHQNEPTGSNDNNDKKEQQDTTKTPSLKSFEDYIGKRFGPYDCDMNLSIIFNDEYNWNYWNSYESQYGRDKQSLAPKLARIDTLLHLMHYVYFDVMDSTFESYPYPIREIVFELDSNKCSAKDNSLQKLTVYSGDGITASTATLEGFVFREMLDWTVKSLSKAKNIPRSFQELYSSSAWSEVDAHQKGFVTRRASQSIGDEFAETYSTYVLNNGGGYTWNEILADAQNALPERQDVVILQKLDICKAYYSDQWAADLDKIKSLTLGRLNDIPKKMDMIMNEEYLPKDKRIIRDWDFSK